MGRRSSTRCAKSRTRAEIAPKSVVMQREPGADLHLAQRLAWPGFVLDLGRGELLDAAGAPTELRAQALKVLLALGERAGQVVSKDELMQRVWGHVVVTEDSLVQAIGDIRRVLGDARHERVRTVPRRAYLLVPPAAAPVPDAVARDTVRALRWPAWLGAALLLVAVGTAAGLARHAPAPPRSLAILPFDSAAGTDGWFVDGVGGDLITLVSSWPEVRVIGRGTMLRYRGKNADPREVARELGVRHVLTGRARRDGDQVRLEVSLVDASGAVVWSELRDMPRAELPALVGDVAGGLARALIVPMGDAAGVDARGLAPQQVQADDLAMQGMAELLRGVSRPNFERSRDLFEQAIALDPNSRRGLGGVVLAHTNLVLWQWSDDPEAAIARSEQTLARLDVVAPEALVTKLAHASMAHVRRDWAAALAIGDRLAALHPNEPTSHHHRCSALLRLGRFQDSIDACTRAQRISPRDSRVPTWQGLIGFNEYLLGHWAAAERGARESVIGNPRVPFYAVVLAAALAEQGRRDEAVRTMQDAMARQPEFRRSTITAHWVGDEPRFDSGRERLLSRAAELGLPP